MFEWKFVDNFRMKSSTWSSTFVTVDQFFNELLLFVKKVFFSVIIKTHTWATSWKAQLLLFGNKKAAKSEFVRADGDVHLYIA